MVPNEFTRGRPGLGPRLVRLCHCRLRQWRGPLVLRDPRPGRAVHGHDALDVTTLNTRTGKGGLGIARRENLEAYLFLLPWIIGFLVLTIGPILAVSGPFLH